MQERERGHRGMHNVQFFPPLAYISINYRAAGSLIAAHKTVLRWDIWFFWSSVDKKPANKKRHQRHDDLYSNFAMEWSINLLILFIISVSFGARVFAS